MSRLKYIGIIEQRDLLLRIIRKPDQRLSRPQPIFGGKVLEGDDPAPPTIVVWGLNHHHSIGVECGEHNPQGIKLLTPLYIQSSRPAMIVQKPPIIVK